MVICNGKFTDEANVLSLNNRAFQYGDALFETIKWSRGKALFWKDHYDRLLQSMLQLKMEVPEDFTEDYLLHLIQQLVIANNCADAARVRLQVYRQQGGFYLPTNNAIGFTITANAIANTIYELNDKPLHIGIYNDSYKTATPLSTIKSANGLMYIMASLYAKENGFDDCYLLNDKGHVIETTNANIFIVKDNLLTTPQLTDGCLNGILRKQVLNFVQNQQIAFKEKSLAVNEVLSADEIILTNTIGGIRLVKCNFHLSWLPDLISHLNI